MFTNLSVDSCLRAKGWRPSSGKGEGTHLAVPAVSM